MRSFDIAAPTTRWQRMARTHGHDFNPFWKCDQCDAIDAEIRAAVAEEREASARALRTRADYDFRCYECGAPHNLDTVIPSEVWNQIAPEGGALCTLCIDDKMAALGLTAEAEFYFAGKALRSRLYHESIGDLELVKRQSAATEREACAKVADGHESPWSEAHPDDARLSRLQGIVASALLAGWNRTDDNEPEHTIALAIFNFLRTGQDDLDVLFGTQTVAAAIRARRDAAP